MKTKSPKKHDALPKTFKPKFWKDCDKRLAFVRELEQRIERLQQETNADSFAKQILCQRAIFIALRLETMEREVAENGTFDPGPYVQATNALVGLLKTLGLNKKGESFRLNDYLKKGRPA